MVTIVWEENLSEGEAVQLISVTLWDRHKFISKGKVWSLHTKLVHLIRPNVGRIRFDGRFEKAASGAGIPRGCQYRPQPLHPSTVQIHQPLILNELHEKGLIDEVVELYTMTHGASEILSIRPLMSSCRIEHAFRSECDDWKSDKRISR